MIPMILITIHFLGFLQCMYIACYQCTEYYKTTCEAAGIQFQTVIFMERHELWCQNLRYTPKIYKIQWSLVISKLEEQGCVWV